MTTASRARQPAIGSVAVLGAHILDVLGRPVESIPPGQGSARLTEIRATAAGTAAGTGVDLASSAPTCWRLVRPATTCSPTC